MSFLLHDLVARVPTWAQSRPRKSEPNKIRGGVSHKARRRRQASHLVGIDHEPLLLLLLLMVLTRETTPFVFSELIITAPGIDIRLVVLRDGCIALFLCPM